jgi:pyruvate,orthophosphate dikinase
MQDLEFTIQDGKLWMLQTRSGKRTAKAALKIAVDMAGEGLITERKPCRASTRRLDQLLHPTIDPNAPSATSSPRAAGLARCCVRRDRVHLSEEAEEAAARAARSFWCGETSPEDIHGMHAAEGILTARGGMTSHAAVVARGMGTPCVSGAGGLRIDGATRPACLRRRQR